MRVRSITVMLNEREDFEGQFSLTFNYVPKGEDDPFLLACTAKAHEYIMATVAGLPPDEGIG